MNEFLWQLAKSLAAALLDALANQNNSSSDQGNKS